MISYRIIMDNSAPHHYRIQRRNFFRRWVEAFMELSTDHYWLREFDTEREAVEFLKTKWKPLSMPEYTVCKVFEK